MLIAQVIRYNAVDAPVKQAAFAQYKYPQARERYARIGAYAGAKGNTDAEKIDSLVDMIQEMKKTLDIPLSIKDYGVNEADFMAKLDTLSELAFDDQCTGANPRYPLIEEIKGLYLKAWSGDTK